MKRIAAILRTPWIVLLLVISAFSCQTLKKTTDVEPPPVPNLPAGFSYDLLYSPSVAEQGTWVSLTFDDQGRLYASDQHGYLYRMNVPAIGTEGSIIAEKVDLELGKAQGLLWAFDALYVSINTREGLGGHENGLYKVTDSDGDDNLDHIETLHILDGDPGEHGPHSIILSPDGESLVHDSRQSYGCT